MSFTSSSTKPPPSRHIDAENYPELLYGTEYASLITPNGSANFVYYQGVDGGIFETSYPRGPSWQELNVVPQGKASLYTPLAAVRWGNGYHFRLFYLSPTFQLCEQVFENNHWSEGALTAEHVQAAPFSKLSVIAFNDGREIRLFYQGKDYKIYERVYSGTWRAGSTMPGQPLPGTALAFVNRNHVEKGLPSIRGYYQEIDSSLREVCWDGGWNLGDFSVKSTDTTFRTPIAVTASPLNDFPRVSVYYLTNEYFVMEITNYHGWSRASNILHTSIAPNSRLTVCSFQRSPDKVDVRLYNTELLNGLGEKVYRDNKWEPYKPSQCIPIGRKLSSQLTIPAEVSTKPPVTDPGSPGAPSPGLPQVSFIRRMVRENLSEVLNRLSSEGKLSGNPLFEGPISAAHGNVPYIDPFHLPKRPHNRSTPLPSDAKVCIVGAGISGLYTALILDHLNVPYDIVESASRPGGRVLTHYFSNRKHDYYDIGAMRFPNIPPMQRTFDLFKRTDVPLIDYHLSGPNNPKRFNGITVFPDKQGDPVKEDPFHVGISNGGQVPDHHLSVAGTIMEEAFAPLKEAIKKGDAAAYEMFMDLDNLTVREYLQERMGLDFHTIQWLEESESGTGQFDAAFTEAVFDAIAFDYGPEEEEWKSIDGGTNLVIEAMVDLIKNKPYYNKRVTRIALDRKGAGEGKMVVTTNYNDEPQRYATVINTTTLACLQRVDTEDLELPTSVKVALRTMHYDSATKVAIKFNNAWWIRKCGITGAGVSRTDLPIRVCVYPSYNIHDDPEKPAILLCTYTWSQDATRIGSLVNLDSPRGEEELKDLMLYNLACLHSTSDNFEEMYELIKRSYITHHGFDWAMDDGSSGAYALFGPGQFRSLYPNLVRPHSDARFHIVGEAASANHAWIAGSIESAYRGVWLFLERYQCYDLQEKMLKEFGSIPELETGENGVAHLLVFLGMMTPQQLKKGKEDAPSMLNQIATRLAVR